MFLMKKDYKSDLKRGYLQKKSLNSNLRIKTVGKEVIPKKEKGRLLNFASIPGCFCWKLAAKARF